MSGNPLSPDSQAFMDMLERHLQEHDATQPAGIPTTTGATTNFSGIPATFQPFPTKTTTMQNAPSPNTMAALINILQVQAQASGLDPAAQQRQLAALLGNMPIGGGLPSQQQAVGGTYPPVHPSQLYAPSTGYPYPGIDTPEHSSPSGRGTSKNPASGSESNGTTPPGAHDASSSPDARAPPPTTGDAAARSRAIHGELEKQARRVLESGGEAHVKRKAGDEEMEGHAAHRSRRGEGVGETDDSEEEHDEKKTSKRATTKGSRRKSAGGAGLDAIVTKGDEDLDAKALKRKNQNRAAQKAFRERREARVKDLEDKVSELEAKNAGNEFENENLRQLLAKLQQENMALKTSAFTFSMPMPGANPSPIGSAQTTSPDPVQQQRVKLPSPPGPQPLQHRGESTSSSASAASNTVRSTSAGSQVQQSRSPAESSTASASVSPFGNGGARASTVFHPERYNAFASSAVPPPARQLSAGEGQQVSSGFATFGQSSATASVQNAGMSSAAPADAGTNEMDWQSLLNNNFTMLAQAPEFMSFSDDAAFGNFGGYSDIWPGLSGVEGGAMAGIDSTLASAGNQFTTIHSKPAVADDTLMNGIAEDNMEEFLRSLGAGPTPAVGNGDDVFDIGFAAPADNTDMLRSYVDSPAYKSTSGPSSSSAQSSILSPGNFFTTSPDASSASSVPSDGKQASASPQASESSQHSAAFRVGTFGGAPTGMKATMLRRDGTVVPCTKIMEEVTSRIPINSGFDLDDLCDHFKTKAVCTGNGPQFKEEDADAILADYAAQRNIKLLSPSSVTMQIPSQPPVPNSDMFFR